MARIIDLVVIFLCVGVVVGASAFGLKTGQHNSFSQSLSSSQGTVMGFDAGLLLIEFSEPVVNPCGDTQIYGFITSPSNLSLQLKPVFIPEAKASKVNDTLLVFPVWDVMPLISEEGAYTIEFFVDNNCSLLHNKTITLPPVPLVLGDGG